MTMFHLAAKAAEMDAEERKLTCTDLDKFVKNRGNMVYLNIDAEKIEPPLAPESLQNLVKLKLNGAGGSVKLLNEILALCPGLLAFALRKSGLVTYSVLKQLAESCPELEHLSLIKCTFVPLPGLTAVFTSCTKLQELCLVECAISDEALEVLGKNCTSLVSLNLAEERRRKLITDKGLAHVFTNCPYLEKVDLSFTEVTDQGLIQLADSYTGQLNAISLQHCVNVTSAGLIHLFERCPNLEKFIISNSCISDAALAKLGANSRLLCVLYLASCWKITDAGAMALFDQTPPLKVVDLSRSQITNKTLERLSSKCKGLQSVNLNGCQNITAAGVRVLLTTNPHLWHLIVLNCNRISQAESEAILRQFPSITRNSPASPPSI